MAYNDNNSGTVYRIIKKLFQVTLMRGLAPHPLRVLYHTHVKYEMKNNKTLVISILGFVSIILFNITKNISFLFVTMVFLISFFYLKFKNR